MSIFNLEMPKKKDFINVPVKDLHLCPICHEPFLEEPQESGLFNGLMVCPHCKEQEKSLFFYWMNCKPLIEEQKPYKVDEQGAFLVNDCYSFIAFRASDRSWDYTVLDEEGELVDSGQIGDETTTFMDAMTYVFENEVGSIRRYEEIPWAIVGHVVRRDIQRTGLGCSESHRDAVVYVEEDLRNVKAGIAENDAAVRLRLPHQLVVGVFQKVFKVDQMLQIFQMFPLPS